MTRNPIRFTSLDEEISGVVRAELGRARVSQGQMAAGIGMHVNVFGRKARGQIAFSPSELSRVAAHLGMTAADLTAAAEARFYAADEVPSSPQAEPESSTVSSSAAEPVRPSPQDLLDHEQVCDSCWSLNDAAEHLTGAQDLSSLAAGSAAGRGTRL